MAIVHESYTGDTASFSETRDKPPGVVAGDYLIAFCAFTASGGDISGWTPLGAIQNASSGGSFFYLAMFGKVATGSEPATYSTNKSGSGTRHFIISRLSGVDTTSPIDGTVTMVEAGSPITTLAVGSITTTVSNAFLYAGAFNYKWDSAPYATIAPPASMTEAVPDQGRLANAKVAAEVETVAAAGATGTRTITFTASSYGAVIIMAALKPAGGGSVGATGTVSAGTATASGLTVSATAGVGVTGSVNVGSATASGLAVSATGGQAASATVSAGTATASGLTVTATAGTGVTGSVTAGTLAPPRQTGKAPPPPQASATREASRQER